MLRGGVFLDIENLTRNGGRSMRFDTVLRLAAAQAGGVTVLRANAYLAADVERERVDAPHRQGKEKYRNALRHAGFHLVIKEVRWFQSEDGERVSKANADLDLAIDAMTQSENLDYVLLGTGDGDFVRLVRALQTRGKRVDVLAFDNVSYDLRREADAFHHGYLLPDMFYDPPAAGDGPPRHRGAFFQVHPDRGFGMILCRTGLKPGDTQEVFCHINEFLPDARPNSLQTVYENETVLEFDLVPSAKNECRFDAKRVGVFQRPAQLTRR